MNRPRAALPPIRAVRPQACRFVLAVALLLFALPLLADDFKVVDVRTRLDGDTYVLDARIDFDFSERALEALDNGVPLTLEVHIQVRPRKDWIWETSLVDQRLRYRIRYKPLSESYLVAQLPGETGRTFVTRDAAVAALGDISGLQLLGKERLDPQQEYEVHLRVSLDIEELPLPLRPMAYLYPSWKQSSKWTKWPLNP